MVALLHAIIAKNTHAMTTIAKALVQKNKLKREVAQLQKKLSTHNSVIAGNVRPFDIVAVDAELNSKTRELAALKANITIANRDVQHKINLMAELRGLISYYRNLVIINGKTKVAYGSDTNTYDCILTERDIEERLRALEHEVEIIQDEMDAHNYLTKM